MEPPPGKASTFTGSFMGIRGGLPEGRAPRVREPSTEEELHTNHTNPIWIRVLGVIRGHPALALEQRALPALIGMSLVTSSPTGGVQIHLNGRGTLGSLAL